MMMPTSNNAVAFLAVMTPLGVQQQCVNGTAEVLPGVFVMQKVLLIAAVNCFTPSRAGVGSCILHYDVCMQKSTFRY